MIDYNECAGQNGGNNCYPAGTCQNTPGSFECVYQTMKINMKSGAFITSISAGNNYYMPTTLVLYTSYIGFVEFDLSPITNNASSPTCNSIQQAQIHFHFSNSDPYGSALAMFYINPGSWDNTLTWNTYNLWMPTYGNDNGTWQMDLDGPLIPTLDGRYRYVNLSVTNINNTIQYRNSLVSITICFFLFFSFFFAN